MRLWLIIFLSLLTAGCGTVSPRTEREIALLRAEILDLGDQYGDLKSRHRRVLSDLAACRGETLGYIPELDEEYYPESRVIGSGIIHTGTPDCCDDCSRLYIEGETIVGRSVFPNVQPMSLEPQPRTPTPAVEPINQPFDDTQPLPNPNNRTNNDSTMRSNLPMEHRLLANKTQDSSWTAQDTAANRLPDAEPAFRPDSQWAQRSPSQLDSNQGAFDSLSNAGSEAPEWRKTSAINANPISSTPIDDRYLDDAFLRRDDFTNTVIQQILINPKNTFAKDYDQDGGDDGIQLLIQPLDSQGRVISRASDVVVSIIDADEIGEAQRIGLWKLEAYQVESLVSNDPGREGLLLDLPWQRRVPVNRDLVVFVRYTNSSGQKLETSLDIEITPPLSDEIQMLDSVGNQRKSRANSRNAQNANAPQWRPVR